MIFFENNLCLASILWRAHQRLLIYAFITPSSTSRGHSHKAGLTQDPDLVSLSRFVLSLKTTNFDLTKVDDLEILELPKVVGRWILCHSSSRRSLLENIFCALVLDSVYTSSPKLYKLTSYTY